VDDTVDLQGDLQEKSEKCKRMKNNQ